MDKPVCPGNRKQTLSIAKKTSPEKRDQTRRFYSWLRYSDCIIFYLFNMLFLSSNGVITPMSKGLYNQSQENSGRQKNDLT